MALQFLLKMYQIRAALIKIRNYGVRMRQIRSYSTVDVNTLVEKTMEESSKLASLTYNLEILCKNRFNWPSVPIVKNECNKLDSSIVLTQEEMYHLYGLMILPVVRQVVAERWKYVLVETTARIFNLYVLIHRIMVFC